MNVTGKVQAANRNGSGFKINEQWYNIPEGSQCPKRGDSVTFVATQANDGRLYAEQLQITPGQSYSGSSGGRRGGYKKDPVDKYGPIIGHNILVAATILGEEGKDLDVLFELVKRITERSEAVVANYTASKTAQPAAQPMPQPMPQPQAAPAPAATPAQSSPAPEFDDDIPW